MRRDQIIEYQRKRFKHRFDFFTRKTKIISEYEFIHNEKIFEKAVENGVLKYWPPLGLDNLNSIRNRLNGYEFSSEVWFEGHLRQAKIRGYVRNWPIGNRFFADFYFPRARLIVEIDGKEHDPIMDGKRDQIVKLFGIRTIRIEKDNLKQCLENVEKIKRNSLARMGFKIQRKFPTMDEFFNYFGREVKPNFVDPNPIKQFKKVVIFKRKNSRIEISK